MADIDTSFMDSYFEKEIPKEDVMANFDISLNTERAITTENYDEYKNYVKDLGKLTWVIKKYYNNAVNENKQIIGEIIVSYLVYYFNCFKSKYQSLNDAMSSTENSNDREKEEISDILDGIGAFIVLVHFKNKYIDIKDLPNAEFISYIAMQENIKPSNINLEELFNPLPYGVKRVGDPEQKFEITRKEMYDILENLKNGRTSSVCEFVENMLIEPEPEPIEMYNEINKIMNSESLPELSADDVIKELGDDIDYEVTTDSEMADTIPNLKQIYDNVKYKNESKDVVIEENKDMPLNVELADPLLVEGNILLENIITQYYDVAWELDTQKHIYNIIKYITLDTVNTESEEIKKGKLMESKYIVYILSFLESIDVL